MKKKTSAYSLIKKQGLKYCVTVVFFTLDMNCLKSFLKLKSPQQQKYSLFIYLVKIIVFISDYHVNAVQDDFTTKLFRSDCFTQCVVPQYT